MIALQNIAMWRRPQSQSVCSDQDETFYDWDKDLGPMAKRLSHVGLGLGAGMLLAVLGPVSQALACACCTEPATRAEYSSEDEYGDTIIELNRLKFGPLAHLYLTDAGAEAILGLENLTRSYSLKATRSVRNWTFQLQHPDGSKGTLVFAIPRTSQYFVTDPQPDPKQSNPVVYKELRVNGTLAGTGMFAAGMTRDTQYRLIFQGRGNGCANPQDFRTWMLEVRGPKAKYRLYGEFLPGR
jgi:hypothetical protein